MSDKHEEFLRGIFGDKSSIMPGSGSGWAKQMDVRGKHREEDFAFAVDGKSTLRASISVTREMWDKAVDQSHNETPALALRFYEDYQLTPGLDLVCVEAQDFKALKEMAEENEALRRKLEEAEDALRDRVDNSQWT